ncbi:MAG: hypothetical protein WCC03_06765 [Candidatus Acidiferrales bacterium]
MGKSEASSTPQAGLGVYPSAIEAIPPVAASSERPFSKKVLSGLRIFAINFVIFAVLAELASLIYINVTKWPGSKPSYQVGYNDFSADINPAFGAWHRPNGHFIHKSGCYSVTYDTNSYGARDVERSMHSSAPRTVVIGDSMIEGVGEPADKRLTNILERDTGRPYLNFGSSSFGPLQDALMYKTMASKFDHDFVLVGIVPDNDFHDMDFAYRKAHGPRGEYRPFYADDFSVYYSGHFDPNAGEGFWDRVEAFLRAYLASYHVGLFVDSRLYWWRMSPYSGYHDYDSVDIARLEKALDDIKATADARGAKMGVVLIPHAIDFQRVHKTGTNPLGPLVEKWGAEHGVAVKDLLPEMAAMSGGDFLAYSLCDGHWSERGGAVVAKILEPWLQPIYAGQSTQTAEAKATAKVDGKSGTNN